MERYGRAAQGEKFDDAEGRSGSMAAGYTDAQLSSVPKGADLGLGCGNPLAYLEVKEGETVLDLGSGAGLDCFLASPQAGVTGRVIGVDVTPEMVSLANNIAAKGYYHNVEFRKGELEHLPLDSESVDVVMSNCAINLAPDKAAVFREAFRVLKKGGRACLSDVVTVGRTPRRLGKSLKAYTACLSGAIPKEMYFAMMEQAGFRDITVEGERRWPFFGGYAEAHFLARK